MTKPSSENGELLLEMKGLRTEAKSESGWNEIVRLRFTGPVDKLRNTLEPMTSVFRWLNSTKCSNKRDNFLIILTGSQDRHKIKPAKSLT